MGRRIHRESITIGGTDKKRSAVQVGREGAQKGDEHTKGGNHKFISHSTDKLHQHQRSDSFSQLIKDSSEIHFGTGG